MQRISEDLIEDLFVRFFTDVNYYCSDMKKCFWQLEKMYWYYLDLEKLKSKPSRDGMKIFLDEIKSYLLEILPKGIDIDKEYEKWMNSRKTIPRCKVILVDSKCENVVLTKGIFNDYLVFPGGKVEETDSSLVECAIRETYEEIGVDIRNYLDESIYFDLTQYGIKNRYFVIPNIDKNIYMLPNVPQEVEYIKWFPISDLPHNYDKYNLRPSNMKLITQSVSALKDFIKDERNFRRLFR